MPKKVAIILLNYKDYAKKFLPDCIESLRKTVYSGELKIFVVDNQSSEDSAVYLRSVAPEAVLIRNEKNDGFAKGNNDGIKSALELGFDYIFLLNLDTVIEPDAIAKLVEAVESDTRIGAVQARLMLWPEKEKVNSLGNETHFLGFGFGEAYLRKYSELNVPDLKPIFYPSGAAVLFKAEVLRKIGLFDEEMWMYNEDQDLGWRVWLSGYRCVLATRAVVYHKYEFSRSISKYYWMDRNRVIAMLRNYHIGTLLLILPAFIIMELGLILFSARTGWFKEKIRVWQWFFCASHWHYIRKVRRESQALRAVNDRDLAGMIAGEITHQEVDDPKLRLINPVFGLYWRIARRLIWW